LAQVFNPCARIYVKIFPTLKATINAEKTRRQKSTASKEYLSLKINAGPSQKPSPAESSPISQVFCSTSRWAAAGVVGHRGGWWELVAWRECQTAVLAQPFRSISVRLVLRIVRRIFAVGDLLNVVVVEPGAHVGSARNSGVEEGASRHSDGVEERSRDRSDLRVAELRLSGRLAGSEEGISKLEAHVEMAVPARLVEAARFGVGVARIDVAMFCQCEN
jgi:hypothetical protein